jgi:hypothetical protein
VFVQTFWKIEIKKRQKKGKKLRSTLGKKGEEISTALALERHAGI